MNQPTCCPSFARSHVHVFDSNPSLPLTRPTQPFSPSELLRSPQSPLAPLGQIASQRPFRSNKSGREWFLIRLEDARTARLPELHWPCNASFPPFEQLHGPSCCSVAGEALLSLERAPRGRDTGLFYPCATLAFLVEEITRRNFCLQLSPQGGTWRPPTNTSATAESGLR